MTEVKFNTTDHEMYIIQRISERAVKQLKLTQDRMALEMDITAAHVNGNPLRLEALATADDFNFTHDVCGIMRHINRIDGKLYDFSPRFTEQKSRR